MLRRSIILLLLAAGCYNPSPPAGAYQCGSDGACPSGQHCTCGLCVSSDAQAACGFSLTASAPQKMAAELTSCPAPSAGSPGGAAPLVVDEHQKFELTVQALEPDKKTPSSQFAGTVALSASWGDVTPSTVTLSGGTATVMVSLNREVSPPQAATITASAGSARSASAKICVQAPRFANDPTLVVQPASATQPFGWADRVVADPSVVKTDAGWRMYFSGAGTTNDRGSLGAATSSDGLHFVAEAKPVLTPANSGFAQILSPTVIKQGSGFQLFYEGKTMASLFAGGPADVAQVTSSSDLGGFGSPMPALLHTACAYCSSGIDFPSVTLDTAAGMQAPPPLMFFTAYKGNTVSIGRADFDGTSFTAQPGPILSGDLGGEAVLLAPHVVLDGSVYKMWYTFARLIDLKRNGDLCDPANRDVIGIGYATSGDGLFWIRSQGNPVLSLATSTFDPSIGALLAGSVGPSDGNDQANGLVMFYSTFRYIPTGDPLAPLACFPNGIGRATRP